MWPDDDEDEELSEDGEELDEEELFERIEAAFREERTMIRSATKRAWLERLRQSYADQIDDQTLEGIAAVRGGDLIELIDERLAELAQRRRQPPEVDGEIARLRAELAARDRRDREAAALWETERRRRQEQERERAGRERAAAARRAQERARQAEAEQRAAAAGLATANAAEIEARAAVLRAQAAHAAKARVRGADAPLPAAVPTASALERAVTEPISDGSERLSPMERADRDALIAVGHWPLAAPRRDSPFWSPDAGWPKDWTLKGFDLATLRGRLGVTQAVMAGQLGVPTIEVARAEEDPREKVRPALQLALTRAIDEFRSASAEPPPQGTTVAPAVTGADLVRFREAHGLTQRQAAERFGVAHGTVAKAELLPAQPLRERLQDALRAALRR